MPGTPNTPAEDALHLRSVLIVIGILGIVAAIVIIAGLLAQEWTTPRRRRSRS